MELKTTVNLKLNEEEVEALKTLLMNVWARVSKDDVNMSQKQKNILCIIGDLLPDKVEEA